MTKLLKDVLESISKELKVFANKLEQLLSSSKIEVPEVLTNAIKPKVNKPE